MAYVGKYVDVRRTEEIIPYLKQNALRVVLYKYGPPGIGEVKSWERVGILNVSKVGSIEIRGDTVKITPTPGYELIVSEDTSFEPRFTVLNIYERKEKPTGLGLGILPAIFGGEEGAEGGTTY